MVRSDPHLSDMKTIEQEITDRIFDRWGVLSKPLLDKEQAAYVLAISLGLGAIFNESAEAERDWIQTPHRDLRTRPITAILAGSFREVLCLVERERGL